MLLDSDFNAQVADFGFAKLIPDGATHVTTRVMGTLGYLAPEYAMLGKASESCDVYSFGILLLGLASGKKPLEKLSASTKELAGGKKRTLGATMKRTITDWALPLACEKKFGEIADPRLNGNFVEEELKRVVFIALMCAQRRPERRPSMLEVVELLKGVSKDKLSFLENDELFRSPMPADCNNGSGVDDGSDFISEEKEPKQEVKEVEGDTGK